MRKFSMLLLLALAVVICLLAACQAPEFLDPILPGPSGPQLTLFVQPEDGESVVLDAINGAEESLKLKVYLLTNPRIIDALKAAVQRGVNVRMIIELNPYGSALDPNTIMDLKDSGIDLKGDSMVFNYTHEKSMIIDDSVGFIMTGNMTASSFSANREYGIITKDPKHIAEMGEVFEADWERVDIDLSDSLLIWAPDNARERIITFIDEAQRSLDVEHQNMQDPEIVQSIKSALARGVRVRIISSPMHPVEEDSDEPFRDELRQRGADVRYMDDPYVHSKVFIIDGERGFVGSQNLTTNSIDFNRELGILFDETAALERLAAQFDADWAVATEDAFPTAGAPIPEDGVIAHRDARQYYYQELTVELTVTHLYNSGRVIWLMPDDNQDDNFKVVIFPSDWDKFPEIPDVLYDGKTIQVSGLIEKYQGWPEIIVDGPEQIVVVD